MHANPAWMLITLGVALVIGGLVWLLAPGLPLGRLPGDIRIETGTTRIYIPIVTCLLVSLVLSAILWVVNYLTR